MADLKAMAMILGGMLLAFPALASPVCATDDLGKEICLEQPAQRIAALSPGATELAWAAGAGDQVVAVVAYSDYPPAARQLPHVGSYNRLDMEAILALEPDLIIAWQSGNPEGYPQREVGAA